MIFADWPVIRPRLYEPQSAWLRHGPFALWLVHALRPRRIVELGTHHGFSYFCFCQAVAEANLATDCFAVDTWVGEEHAGFYDDKVHELVVERNLPYAGFSKLLRKTFAEALGDIEDGSVDLLHVDGRHFYEDVKEDFQSWMPKLSPRAVVMFHDTEVRQNDFGVWRYWSEISPGRPSINFPYQHGLGVLLWGSEIAEGIMPLAALLADPAGVKRIIETFQTLGDGFATPPELEGVQRELVAERDAARMLQQELAGARQIEAELAASQARLRHARHHPLEIVGQNIAFRALRILAGYSPPLSRRTAARLARSATKRDPDR